MNSLLKAMLKEAMDFVAVGKKAVAKDWAGLFSSLIGAGSDIPPIVANWSDLHPELQALLKDPASDADLLAYAVSLLGSESAAAQQVIVASADLILAVGQKGYALYSAIEAAKAPAAPAKA